MGGCVSHRLEGDPQTRPENYVFHKMLFSKQNNIHFITFFDGDRFSL
jgi:hypothetical protein